MSSPDLLQHIESLRGALERFLTTVLGREVSVDVGTPGRPSAILADAESARLVRPPGDRPRWAVYLAEDWIPALSQAMIGEAMEPDQDGSSDLLCEVVSQGYEAVRQFMAAQDVALPEADVKLDRDHDVAYGDSAQAITFSIEHGGATLCGWLVVQPEASDGDVTLLSQITGIVSDDPGSADDAVAVAPARFPDLGPETLTGGDGLPPNFELMAEVQLELTVELGRRSIPLADILRLTTGSVIELEKLVGEPLEVYANGRLIAEGEAVVIDEQFGIRITRLASVRQRARALS